MTHAAPPHRRSTDRPVSTSVVVCALLLLVCLAAGFVVLGVKGANSAAFGAFAAGAVPVASTVIVAAVKVDRVSNQLDGVSAQLGAGLAQFFPPSTSAAGLPPGAAVDPTSPAPANVPAGAGDSEPGTVGVPPVTPEGAPLDPLGSAPFSGERG